MEQNVVIKFIGDTSQLTKDLEESLSGVGADAAKEFKAANTEAAKYAATIDKAEKEVLAMAKAEGYSAKEGKVLLQLFKDVTKEVATGAIMEYAGDMQVLGTEIVETTEKTKSMKAQLRELKEQIANATDPAEIQRLSAAAGVLQDDIGDLNAKIKGLASDTRVFDGLLDAASGLAGGFAVLQGAQALVGTESKEIEKTLLKVNAAMSILQGLQQIQNVLQEESAASLLLGNVQRKIEVALTSESVVARTAATVAQYALNAAMNLFPLVAIVSGLILAVKALNSYTAAAKDTGEAQRKLNKELEIQLQYLGAASKQFQTSADVRKVQLEGELALLKSIGASENEIKSKEIEIAEARLKTATINKTLYKDLIANIQNEDKLNKQLEIRRKLEQELADINRTPEDDQTKSQKRRATDIQTSLKLIQELVDKGTAILQEYNDAQNELLEIQLTAQKDASDKSFAIEEARLKAIIALREAAGKDAYIQTLNLLAFQLSALESGSAAYIDKAAEIEVVKIKRIKAISDEAAAAARRADEFNEQTKLTLIDQTNKSIKDGQDAITNNALVNSKVRNKATLAETDVLLAEIEKRKAASEALEKQLNQQKIDFAIGAAQEISNALFTIDADNRQYQLDEDLKALNKRKEAELDNRELTENQKAAINDKYARQEYNLKKRAFEAEKQAKIAEAAVNLLLGITKILATYPPGTPQGFLAPLAIGLTTVAFAAQVATISAKKYPAYAKGRRGGKGEFALVGEQGPEMMYVPAGASIEPAGRTKNALNQYTIPELNSLLAGPPLPDFNMAELAPGRVGSVVVPEFDYAKMGKMFAGEIARNPQLRVSIDQKGFNLQKISNGRKVNFKNGKYVQNGS